MFKRLLVLPAVLFSFLLHAQVTPEISSWIRNTTNATGYNNIPSNVQMVQYSASNVYVSCTGIPGYSIGPWQGNPNVASNQNFVFKITRNPVQNTGTAVNVGLGHIGVWSNGVSIFNADDGMTYNNAGVWHRNAYFWEGPSFDNCLGHPQQSGEYHHHVSPNCLYDQADSTHHSPIIGYAFDGFPVYGAYGYTNTDGTGAIKRMASSYQLRNITDRTTLPGGATASSAGPAISASYPLGAYIQDYEFVTGSGDLDIHNGRFCVTPDYPNGIYAYFVTIDATLTPSYPYTLGTTYYGTVQAGNTGPNSGHNTITETTTVYTGTSSAEDVPNIKYKLYPNPSKGFVYLYLEPGSVNNISARVYDGMGSLVETIDVMQPSISYTFDFTRHPSGMYLLVMQSEGKTVTQKILVNR